MNPWTELPTSPPYVLPSDAAAVAAFNERAKPDHTIHLEIVPEPFLGDPNAPVVLLNLNPGFSDSDHKVHLDPAFNAAARANLLHRHPDWPFYLLDPGLPSPGRDWWMERLSALIKAVGIEAVASNVFVAELHGYHSWKFHYRLRVPSQRYTFRLVKQAIDRGALIVVMRGFRTWVQEVPRLAAITVTRVRNPRKPYISPGNCPESFDAIVRAVRK